MSTSSYIHTWNDGRGNRDVFVNGKLVKMAVYAHIRKGVVRLYRQPFKLDKHRKRALTKTLHGKVTVQFREPAEQP